MKHLSDCAVYNEPMLPNGLCDCGYVEDNMAVNRVLEMGRESLPQPYQWRLRFVINKLRKVRGQLK